MTNEVYAVVDGEGNIVNAVLWDGETEWTPGEGLKAVACGDANCQIGGTYKKGKFYPPAVAEIPKEDLVAQANAGKKWLMSEANAFTQPWQTQLMLGIITDADKESLTTWMKYYQSLQAVDTSSAPDIEWPVKPGS